MPHLLEDARVAPPIVTAARGVPRGIVALLLVAALLAGAAVRLYHVGSRTITHPEMYVPGIPLPAGVLDPPQRMTVAEVLQAAIGLDIHPPGYYLVMLGWDRAFGTGLFALRFLSVLLGVLAILLVFRYTRSFFGTAAALFSAWLLALHGGQVLYSQMARPWVLLSVLALASVLLLRRLERGWQAPAGVAYLLVNAVGMWVDYYYWPVFAVQVLYVAVNDADAPRLPRLLTAQLGSFMLSLPVLVYLWSQVGRQTHLSGSVWTYFLYMCQFGVIYLVRDEQTRVWLTPLGVGVAIVGAVALVNGLVHAWRGREGRSAELRSTGDGRALLWLVIPAVASCIITEAVFGRTLGLGQYRSVRAALIAPWLLLAGWATLNAGWRTASAPLRWVGRQRWLQALLTLPALLTVVMLSLMAIVHARKPFLISYALVAFAPFWVAAMAGGIAAMRTHVRYAAMAATLIVAAFTTYSVEVASPGRDYRGLAAQIMPNIRSGDAILMERGWSSEPMLYYLKPSLYHVETISSRATRVATTSPRVWVIAFGSESDARSRFATVNSLIPRHRPAELLLARDGAAMLFVRSD